MSKLTRSQLEAVALLHKHGTIGSNGRPGGFAYRKFSADTLDALIRAGVAKRESAGSLSPVLTPWADGHGVWHVRVPFTGDAAAQRAVARAVIAGEVWSRETQAYVDNFRPRVRPYVGREGSTDPNGFVHYEEV